MDGLLVVDKPAGWTSHDVVARLRRLAGERRIGHAGTLDPIATGVLPCGLGRATRLLEFLSEAGKTYLLTVRLGVETDTYDASGTVAATAPVPELDEARLRALLHQFEGEQLQRPPAFSAVKVSGERAYRLARRGEPPELPPRRVTIERLELLRWEPPDLVLEMDCSKGTYARALAHDIGARLGCGGHLAALVRTRVGHVRLEDALSIEEIERAAAESHFAAIVSAPDEAVLGLDAAILGQRHSLAVRQGNPIDLLRVQPRARDGRLVRAYSYLGDFLALIRFDARSGLFRPDRVLLPIQPVPRP